MVKIAVIGASILAVCGACAAAAAPQAPRVVEQAQVPTGAGERTIAVLKSGKKLETITCRDFGVIEARFRPQAVSYAANYGAKGRAHPTATVTGVEQVVPAVVDMCRARPGDHFVTAVHSAMKAQRR